MSLNFEELDYRQTRLGALSLRRRRLPRTGQTDIYEVKLGDEFLMSSLFVEAEEALARLGLQRFARQTVDVVVGGLGLGYTAAAALAFTNVRSLLVIETLAPVIDWHRQELLPLGQRLTSDPRCQFIEADFFALAESAVQGFDPQSHGRCFDAILLDIDHAPDNFLHSQHARFYHPSGLEQLTQYMHQGGVFGLWSNDPPNADFVQRLKAVFADVETHIIEFDNVLQGRRSTNTVYIACLGH